MAVRLKQRSDQQHWYKEQKRKSPKDSEAGAVGEGPVAE